MKNYLNLMQQILTDGTTHPDRTGTGRRTVFGPQLRFDLNDGFPLVTTRDVPTKPFIAELLWHISGSDDVRDLHKHGVHIWDHWAVTQDNIDTLVCGDKTNAENQIYCVGPIYGPNWRGTQNKDNPDPFLKPSDQLTDLLVGLKTNPWSSRHVISAWIPQYIPNEGYSPQLNVLLGKGALAPCPVMQHYMVSPPRIEGGRLRLSMKLTQRSADFAIGSCSNIAQYALLLAMIAQVVDMEPYEFIYSLGDAHLYTNHLEQARIQIQRTPQRLPTLRLNPAVTSLYDFCLEDITIDDYCPLPAIKYPISV